MRVKICGITNLNDAKCAVDAGADALGFLAGITHLAEDKIDISDASDIIKQLPPFVTKVAVTHYTSSEDIIPILKITNVDTVQLQNEITIEAIEEIINILPYLKVIKAISIIDESSIEKARRFDGIVDALLLDSRTTDRLGGTGNTHDWNISKQIVGIVKCPVILAGGLTPANLMNAIELTKPFAVDVNSGVETNGIKDKEKVKDFIRIARLY